MRNAFAGICYRCGKMVEPGAGFFQKTNRAADKKRWGVSFVSAWLTQHDTCAAKYRGTDTHYLYRPAGELEIGH